MMIHRPADTIKHDMLEWAKENIYARMGEEWDYNGRDFDPLVHLMVGACASELKGIYEAIEGTDRRVVKKLAELLMPEYTHMATPASALAAATPTASSARLSETMQFQCATEAGLLHFTPAYSCTILSSTLKVVGSDGLIFQYKPGQEKRAGSYANVSKLLLGFEAPKPITTFDNVLFYFNLLGENNQMLFLQALYEGQWKINGQIIKKFRGFSRESDAVETQSELESTMLYQVDQLYKPYFFTTEEYPVHASFRRNISEVIITWLRENHTSTPGLEQQAHALPMVEDNFFWLEIQLPYPVRVFELEKNFRCATNIFPVINRKLNIKDDADTFLNRPLLDVVSISPEKPFLGVHKVENLQNKEVLQSLPFNQLKRSRGPAYSIRYGGVGRIDNFNAWNRFSYLLGLFREEHQYRQVLERIGSKVSIEELHLMIGERILQDEPAQKEQEGSIYFFLYPGNSIKNGIRARIAYWTTDGSKANLIPSGKALVCSPPDPSLRKEDLMLVTSPTGGKDAPSETEYYSLLRNHLLKRDKIVTGDDVKRFCFNYLGKSLIGVNIEPGVQVDPRPEGGIMRVSQVILQVENMADPLWLNTCRELEYLLIEKSNGVVPYVVKLKEDGSY